MNVSIIRVAAGFVLSLAIGVAPALALPGQTLSQFKKWAAGNRYFSSNLRSIRGELSGLPTFHVANADHGVAWDLQVETDGTIVTSELFGMTDSPKEIGSEPIAHDGKGYGFTFFTSVFGAPVAADYRNAKLVASVTDPVAKMTSTFYRGARYGYELTQGYIALQTHSYFTANLAAAQKCSKHPSGCGE